MAFEAREGTFTFTVAKGLSLEVYRCETYCALEAHSLG